MCCNNKVSFGVRSMSDMVVAENGVAISPLSVGAYMASKPQGEYWNEPSRFGYPGVCTALPFGADLVLTLNDGTSNYDTTPTAFVGGHPVHRPPTS